MNKNFNSHRFRSYTIVFGLLIVSFLLVFGGLIFRSKLHPDFPLVFTDSNNKLMVITKSNNSKNDIASITDANIVYANNDTKHLLYTNNNSLYLLDTTIEGVGVKITSHVLSYGFSKDDKYIYYIDNNHDFYLYDRQTDSSEKIASFVSDVEVIQDDNLIYNQDGHLIYQKIGEEAKVISDSYNSVELSSDNKLILYSVISLDLKDYYVYDILNSSSKKVLDGVYKLYANDNNYTKFIYIKPSTTDKDISNLLVDDYKTSDKNFTFYTYDDYLKRKITKVQYENNKEEAKNVEFRNQIREYLQNYKRFGYDLYYQNNGNSSLIASNINKLYYHDIKNQIYSYSTYSFEDNSLNISDFDDFDKFTNEVEQIKLNSLYYKQGNSNESMAYKNITSDAKVIIRGNNEYYLIVKDGEYYNLYYSKIVNRSLKLVGEIDTNLITYKINIDYNDGYLYSNYINGVYYLNVVSEGRTKTLTSDINYDYVEVSEGKDSIYYLRKTGDNINDLMIYNGIRTSKIAGDIYSFMYINNDLIYITKDYDSVTKTSDLYRLNSNNKLTLIYKDIADWYSPLKNDLIESDIEEESLIETTTEEKDS